MDKNNPESFHPNMAVLWVLNAFFSTGIVLLMHDAWPVIITGLYGALIYFYFEAKQRDQTYVKRNLLGFAQCLGLALYALLGIQHDAFLVLCAVPIALFIGVLFIATWHYILWCVQMVVDAGQRLLHG